MSFSSSDFLFGSEIYLVENFKPKIRDVHCSAYRLQVRYTHDSEEMDIGKGMVFITGANGGLGSAIASQVASQPEFAEYHGVYAVRDA